MNRNLTERQVSVLAQEYNLADGHAYRGWNDAELAVLDASPARFRQVDRRQQQSIETDFFCAFHALGGQTFDQTRFERFPCFTASAGIEVVANYLRLNGLSATLIEPCFDNLADILKRHHIPLRLFPEHLLEADPQALDQALAGLSSDVLFLVSPNNPSGTTIGEANFARLLEFCARTGTMLILDCCFRFYLPEHTVYDQYRMLIEADIDCIVIEDTGKTWPTLELKAPFIAVSQRLADPIARINSDFLLHVSPFAVGLMTDFLELSLRDGRGHIRDVVAQNRATLYAALEPTVLQPIERPFMSVSWVELGADITSADLARLLDRSGVHVLAGNQFFWSRPELGDSFIRVALVRDPATFTRAATRLTQVCLDLDTVAVAR